MTETLLCPRNLAFELYEVLDAEALTRRERFADHSRETFDAAIATATPWCNAGETAAWPRLGEVSPPPDDVQRTAQACAAMPPESSTALPLCRRLARLS